MQEKRGFTNRIGYILTLAGFCIGIGNMWKFPYMVGANGGGVFLIIYVLLAMLVGVPLFIVETSLGRTSQQAGIAGMRKLSGGKKSIWSLCIGWLGFVTVFMICCYFWTIIGWNIGYIGKLLKGSLFGLDVDTTAAVFTEFSGSWACVACVALCVALCWILMNTGAGKAVEKVCVFAMPMLIIMLLGLMVYSNTLPGSRAGLLWYLTPKLEGVNLIQTFQAAAVQVFYSIGVGMCCGFVYGSYIGKDANLIADTTICCILDTLVATLVGLVITPALFAFGIAPDSGPSLIFITLPQLFTAMGKTTGIIFGVIYLIAVFLACITSMVSVLESLIRNLMDLHQMTRKKAAAIIISITFALSVLVTLNQGTGVLSNLKILDMDLFSLLDCASAAFGLTIGAIFMWVFIMFKWGFAKFQKEANAGANGKIRIWNWMKWYYMIPLPLILFFIVYCILKSYFG